LYGRYDSVYDQEVVSMNVTYTGKQESFHQRQKDQIDSKLAKISKLLDVDGKSQKSARVVFSHDKSMHKAEVTLNYLDHTLIGEHVDPDQFSALTTAIERLERQMLKTRDKRRDPKKGSRDMDKGSTADAENQPQPEPAAAKSSPASNGRPKVFRVEPTDGKPLTQEEAVLEIEDDPYLVYRSANGDRIAVLLRRPDGNFDLVEC
jgi:putative sigma-54 modulation protein